MHDRRFHSPWFRGQVLKICDNLRQSLEFALARLLIDPRNRHILFFIFPKLYFISFFVPCATIPICDFPQGVCQLPYIVVF